MKAYQDYKKYAESVEKALEQERLKIADRVLREVRECVAEFDFKPEDVFSARRKRCPKYYDPETGQTWSGVGREPLWIRGKDRRSFELNQSTECVNDGAQDQ
ncbi:H-NS histone family protein [Burkholderia cenocepacia]|uniref:H-NS histone family protein n=1 Tax=Burkholderia cenocepacia TaxID=95486 RepID=UPI002AB5F958|nr:H-NS histone family protein [Burkholderia cenocepacia]